MVTDKGVPTKPEGFVGRGAAVRTTKPLFRMKMRRVTRTRRDDGGELGIRTLGSLREHSISSAAPSTTRTTLRVLLSLKFCEKPKGRTAGQNSKIFNFRTCEKPRKMGIFVRTKLTQEPTISSQARYDRFDTSPYSILAAGRYEKYDFKSASL